MGWLDDSILEEFFDSFGRTTVFTIGASRFGVLNRETGAYMGLIVEHSRGYDVFSRRLYKGKRVRDFDTALALVDHTESAAYHEYVTQTPVGEEATDGD